MLKRSSIIAFLFIVILTSCDKYNKILKSSDMDKKYEAAMQYYNKEDYFHASGLFEELLTVFRGTARAEEVMYYYAYSNYNLSDYILASYHFRNYVRTYPTGKHTEECAYMGAYCYYLTSPGYSLDQTDTYQAIRELQAFVNQFPSSTRVAEANSIIDKLREKLERKAYETAKMYYNINDYRAAVIAFNNLLKDFPGSKHAEEVYFLTVRSNYLLAINSIESKKAERYQATIDAYFKFIDKFPNSRNIKTAEDIYNSTIKLQKQNKTT